MISEDELVHIYAEQLAKTQKMALILAVDEVRRSLFGNEAARSSLLAITEAVWKHGLYSVKVRPLTVEQKCALVNCNPDVPGVMNLVDSIERAILENNRAENR